MIMPKGETKKRYTKEIAKKLPDMFKNGESIVEVCVELGISRQSFYDWCAKYPEFKKAAEHGKDKSEAWWTKLGRGGAAGAVNIKAAPWIFNMKNRFGWTDGATTTGDTDDLADSLKELFESLPN